ncbi:MAG TPA: cytochrome d ubiquinol oxidase subunit II [Trebonia sp.]|nr:cytochrome d ubiquinol oxidase subunit II [Trebonia sp.]
MTSQAGWLWALGWLFAGFFVLEGFDFGLALAMPFLGRSGVQRRLVINAMGPFFLGNEVWLVGTVGVLAGAMPVLDDDLLTGLYPLIVAILVCWVVRDAGIWFRSRRDGRGWRLGWDGAIVAGSALLAALWGVVVADLMQGLAMSAPGQVAAGPASLLDPFSVVSGLAFAAICLVHGTVFTALRCPGTLRERAVRLTRWALPLAVALLALAVAAGALTRQVRVSVGHPAIVLVLAVVLALLLVVAALLAARGRTGWAFTATALAMAIPVAMLAAAADPYALVWATTARSGLTPARIIAGTPTLSLLSYTLLPFFPLILLYQAWSWWTFGAPYNRARRTVFF